MMKRAIKISSALGVVAILGMGVLHAPFARSFLMKVGGCPVGKASATDVDEARKQAVTSIRGSANEAAPKRPALGFVLGETKRASVQAWSKAEDLTCQEKRDGMLVVCKNVPAAKLGDRAPTERSVDEVTFAFRPADAALVNVTAISYGLGAGDAADRMSRTTVRLTNDLGRQPTTANGEISEARFAKGNLATSETSFRFTDYIAEVSATSFGSRGVVLREHYVID